MNDAMETTANQPCSPWRSSFHNSRNLIILNIFQIIHKQNSFFITLIKIRFYTIKMIHSMVLIQIIKWANYECISINVLPRVFWDNTFIEIIIITILILAFREKFSIIIILQKLTKCLKCLMEGFRSIEEISWISNGSNTRIRK